jgi:hypothetical protein
MEVKQNAIIISNVQVSLRAMLELKNSTEVLGLNERLTELQLLAKSSIMRRKRLQDRQH